jgi:putative transposon-encoded protein
MDKIQELEVIVIGIGNRAHVFVFKEWLDKRITVILLKQAL